MIDRITVFCSSAQELQEWLEHLQPFTKGGSPASTISKVRTDRHTYTCIQNSTKSESYTVPRCENQKVTNGRLMFHHTCTVILMYLLCFLLSGSMQNADGKPVSMIGATTHPHHQGSFSSVSRGPLEPPKISKPWSLSCLRPAPPLKPSAALGYKEVENCTVAQTNPHQSLSISHSIHCQKPVPIAEVPFLCLPTAISVFVNLSSLTVMF